MREKKRRKNALWRIVSRHCSCRVTGALAALALCALLSGCGSAESSSRPAVDTAAASVTAITQIHSTTEDTPAQTTDKKSDSKSKTSTKKTAKTTQRSASATESTAGSRSASKNTDTPAPQTTGVQTSQKSTPAQTTASLQTEYANATVSESTKATAISTAEKKPAVTQPKTTQKPESQQYHVYADGYVTKYDELKLKNLTADERNAYNALSEGIWKMQKDITIPAGVINEKDAADFLYLVMSTMPEVNYVKGTFKIRVSGGYIKKFTIDYTLSKQQANEQHKKLRDAASKIIGSLDSDMTDYEKVMFFHDHIIKNCVYDNENQNCYNAYGCLVEGRAVCEGYAMAMDYLCEKAGIYTALESGNSVNSAGVSQSHIWNKININGKWYNFDLTWDDPISDFGSEYVRYDYFALSDEDIGRSHTVRKNKFAYYPKAESEDLNYFRKYGFYITDSGQTQDIMQNSLAAMLLNGGSVASIRCNSEETFNDTIQQLLGQNPSSGSHNVYEYLCAAMDSTGKDFDYNGYYLLKNDRFAIAAIVFK